MNKESTPETRLIVRIAGRDLDGKKPVKRAIWKIKGVSFMFANAVVKKLGVQDKKVGDLSEQELKKLEDIISNPLKNGIPSWLCNRRRDVETGEDSHILEANLDIQKRFDVRRLMEIKSRRGLRHSWGLKVRGQRTKSHPRRGSSVGVKRKKQQPGGAKK